MQVHDFLINAASADGTALFVYDNGTWHNYAQVLKTARQLAFRLCEELHIEKGSRVGVYWENSVWAIAASFGVWMAGCILVPLNTEVKGEDLAYQIHDSETRVVVAGKKQLRHIHGVADQLREVVCVVAEDPLPPDGAVSGRPGFYQSWNELCAAGKELAQPVRTIDIDLASIVYTSGSTGKPKGVMLSHLNLVSNMRSIAEYLNLSARDRIMMILPHFYIYGLSLVLTHTLVGGSIVLDNRFLYPNVILDTMKETEATGFAGVPSTFSILLSRSTLSDARFPALRYVTQAGGAMPPAVQKEVVEAFAPAQLFVMYGATEAAPRLTYVEPSMLPLKWGSIGKAIPNVEVFVADEAGNRLGTGIEGEIAARGSNITAGYWKDPEGSARVLKHGLYFTGDLGMEDADGYLYVTGRAKNILKVKGFRVSPKEIEEHLTEFDGITDAAVIGVPDEVLGEAPVAFLVTRGGIMVNSSNLKKFLQDRIASYKIPIEFIHRDDLPKNAAGKIDKKELLVLYKGGIE